MPKKIYVGNLPVKDGAKTVEIDKKTIKPIKGDRVVINHEEQYSVKKDGKKR